MRSLPAPASSSTRASRTSFSVRTRLLPFRPAPRADSRVGHSERRTLFGETSKLVADKTRAAISAGLAVILCVGETLAEREAGKTIEVVEAQVVEAVKLLSKEDWACVPDHCVLDLRSPDLPLLQ